MSKKRKVLNPIKEVKRRARMHGAPPGTRVIGDKRRKIREKLSREETLLRKIFREEGD
jgi:hypothetical protein